MITLRSSEEPPMWDRTRKGDEIAESLNCTIKNNKMSPHWERVEFTELVNLLNSDPKITPESKLNVPVIFVEQKSKSRFSDLDIV
jgi:hypothetical protein